MKPNNLIKKGRRWWGGVRSVSARTWELCRSNSLPALIPTLSWHGASHFHINRISSETQAEGSNVSERTNLNIGRQKTMLSIRLFLKPQTPWKSPLRPPAPSARLSGRRWDENASFQFYFHCVGERCWTLQYVERLPCAAAASRCSCLLNPPPLPTKMPLSKRVQTVYFSFSLCL